MKTNYRLSSNKLATTFRVFSWDILFFYLFSAVFLSQVRGFSDSQIFYTGLVVAATPVLLQFLINKIAKAMGALKSVRFGMLCLFVFTIGIVFFSSPVLIFISYFFYGLGSAFLVPNTSALLVKNLKAEGREEDFAKIEGRAAAIYYFTGGLASIGLGYLFEINPLLVMAFSAIAMAVGFLMSFMICEEGPSFAVVSTKMQPESKKKIKPNPNFIFLLCLVLAFYGLIMQENSLRQVLFQNVLSAPSMIGWINFAVSVSTGLSGLPFDFFKKRAKLTLTILPIGYLFLLLAMGLVCWLINSLAAAQVVIMLGCCILPFFNLPFKIGAKDYVRQIVSEENQASAYSMLYVVRNLSRIFYSLLLALLAGRVGSLQSLMLLPLFYLLLLAISLPIYLVQKKRKFSSN